MDKEQSFYELFDRISLVDEQLTDLIQKVELYSKDGIETVVPYRMSLNSSFQLLMRTRKSIPLDYRVTSGLIVNELRAILDNSVSILAAENGFPDDRTVHFPISHSKAAFEKDGLRKIRKLSDPDKRLVASITPYAGGNDYLYNLHRIDIMRKHIRLSQNLQRVGGFRVKTPGMRYDNHNIGTDWPGSINSVSVMDGNKYLHFKQPEKLTTEFQHVASFSDAAFEFYDFRLRIHFDYPEEVMDQPLVGTLSAFAREVRKVVNTLAIGSAGPR